jgi:hypothetical protein
MSTVRDQFVAEYTSAEYRYIAAVALRKAAETLNADGGHARTIRVARANEADANAELVLARKACEDAGIPVDSRPILSLLYSLYSLAAARRRMTPFDASQDGRDTT